MLGLLSDPEGNAIDPNSETARQLGELASPAVTGESEEDQPTQKVLNNLKIIQDMID